jgi:chorismate mutase
MDELGRLRGEIEALDRAVLETLNRRLELVHRVNAHKQETGAAPIDAGREAALLAELQAANAGPLSSRGVQSVFAAVLDVMKQEARGEPRPAPPAAAPAPPAGCVI